MLRCLLALFGHPAAAAAKRPGARCEQHCDHGRHLQRRLHWEDDHRRARLRLPAEHNPLGPVVDRRNLLA
eukprot:5026143-Pyramimonas_sp.AAC.1